MYEYIHLIKNKFDLKKTVVDDIAVKSVFGVDKKNYLAAYLNLSLIGDGTANLQRVKTTINWRTQFLYKNHTDEKFEVTKLEDDEIKLNLNSYSQDIEFLLKLYAPLNFKFDKAELENYLEDPNPLHSYLISSLGWDKIGKDATYLGNVDLLLTNVPYGKVTEANEQIIENGDKTYGNALETNALRECIDFLKPAKMKNGKYIEEGGIGIIIIPDAILENPTNKPIRDYLISRCNLLGIVSLPTYTFSPYAMEKTYALVIQKIAPEEFNYDREINTNTFMYYSVCDGRANSQNRFLTTLIHRTKFKSPNNMTRDVIEFLHNDFEPCYDSYSDKETTYVSKLENAWNQSITINNPEWDQERVLDTWTPEGWEHLSGKKWGYHVIKRIEKKIETYVKCLSLNRKIGDFVSGLSETEKEQYFGIENFEKFKKTFLNSSKLTPNEKATLDSLSYVEENEMLGQREILLVKIEMVKDIDLNIDSSNYLGKPERKIRIEDILADLSTMKSLSEEELIEYFSNSFISAKITPIKLVNKFDIIQGTQFSKQDAYLNTGNTPVFTAATTGPAYYVADNIKDKVKVQGPSLIWSRKGAKAGTIQIFDEKDKLGDYKECYISDVSGVIKPKRELENCDFTFLKYYVAGQVKRLLQSKTNNAQLNKGKLENLDVYLPDNQVEIGNVIRQKLIQ